MAIIPLVQSIEWHGIFASVPPVLRHAEDQPCFLARQGEYDPRG